MLLDKDWHFLFVTGEEGFPIRVSPNPHLGVLVPEPFSYLKRLNTPHTYKHIGFSEDFYSGGVHTAVAVTQYCMNHRPDVVFICCQYLEGAFDDGLVLQVLRGMKIPVVLMWLDSFMEGYRRRIENFKKWASCQLVFDNPLFNEPGCFYTGPPIRDTLFTTCNKDINVSFTGNWNNYGGREAYLQAVEDLGLWKGGGKGYKWEPGEFYDTVIQRSKIVLNFPWSYDCSNVQVKARVYEATAAGALLLEGRNPLTPLVFRENIDYAPFDSPEDLRRKVGYFLENEAEREKIARTGQERCWSLYGMEQWWERVLRRVFDA
jgi:hypothetical protein